MFLTKRQIMAQVEFKTQASQSRSSSSKSTTSLVNDSLKFQVAILEILCYFIIITNNNKLFCCCCCC